MNFQLGHLMSCGAYCPIRFRDDLQKKKIKKKIVEWTSTCYLWGAYWPSHIDGLWIREYEYHIQCRHSYLFDLKLWNWQLNQMTPNETCTLQFTYKGNYSLQRKVHTVWPYEREERDENNLGSCISMSYTLHNICCLMDGWQPSWQKSLFILHMKAWAVRLVGLVPLIVFTRVNMNSCASNLYLVKRVKAYCIIH